MNKICDFMNDPVQYAAERMGRELTPKQRNVAAVALGVFGLIIYSGGVAVAFTSHLWTASLLLPAGAFLLGWVGGTPLCLGGFNSLERVNKHKGW